MHLKLRLVSLIIGLGLSSLVCGEAPSTASDQSKTAPLVIDAQDIPLQAQRVDSELQYIKEDIKNGSAETFLESRLESLSGQITDLLENPSSTRPEQLGGRARDLYKQKWAALQSELEAWSRDLDKEVSAVQAQRTKLKALSASWQATADAYPGERLGQALTQRVQQTLAHIQELDNLYSQQLAVLSRLYQEGQAKDRMLSGTLNHYEIAEKKAISQMMSLDSPPLWRAFDATGSDRDVRIAPRHKVSTPRDWQTWASANRGTLIIHGLILVAMLALTLPLARRRRQWEEKELLAPAVKLFATPVSMALLLTLLASAAFFYTLPLRIQDLRSLLVGLLTLRVLHQVLEGRIRKMLYMSMGLFIAAKLTDIADDFSLAERFGLLFVNLVAAVFALYVSRALPKEAGQDRWWAWARVAANAVLPLLGIGLIANLVGYVSLAQIITTGSVYSIATGVVLASGVFILETIFTAVMHVQRVPQLGVLYRNRTLIEPRVFLVLRMAAVLSWINFTLVFFRSQDWVKTHLAQIITYRVQLGSLDLSALDVIAFAASIYVATLISRFIRFILEEEVYQHISLPRGLPNTVSMLVNYSILALGFFVAISVAGLDLSRFAIVAGALGVGIGFGLQNVVNNFVSGLILAFERPVQVGDTIEVGHLIGRVMRIGIRSSTVRTYDGAEVIVPNGNLISAEVVNWTLSDRSRRLTIKVGVAYGSDPKQVLELLNAVVVEYSGVMQSPEPTVIFDGFGDSSLDFSVRAWIKDFEEIFRISSDLTVLIYAALNKAGIEIPFPQRDLHLRSVSSGVTLSAPLSPEADSTAK